MIKASSLLLLTLVLIVHLCSSAPITANVVAPEVHSHFIQKRESLEEKLIPVAAGEAAPSPQESPAEEDIPVTAKEPEPISLGDEVSDDADEAKSQKSDTQSDPLATAPQESPEEETIPVDSAFAEASPEETPEEVDSAVAVKSESAEQHHVDDVAPDAPIPVIPLEASEDEIPEEDGEEEDALEEPLLIVPDDTPEIEETSIVLIAEETAPEESAPEEPDVILPVEPAEQKSNEEEEEETISVILTETKEEKAPDEHATEQEALVPIVLEENPEEDPATDEELLPTALEEQDSVSLLPTEVEDQVEPVIEETEPEESAPEEPVVIVPVETAEQEPDQDEQDETVSIILPETKEEEAPEDSVVIVPVETAEQEPDQDEQEETVSIILPETKEEEAPEDSVVIVNLDTAEEEPKLEEQVKEETTTIVSAEAPEEETPEEHIEVEAVGGAVPIVPEEDAEEDLATNEEPLPSTLEEEESAAHFPIEGEDQVEPVAEETSPEGPVVIIPLDPAEEELGLEGQVTEETIAIVSAEVPEEETPEEHTEVEAAGGAVLIVPEEDAEEDLATNEEPLPSTLEEEESATHFPIEGEDQVEPAAEETSPEGPVVIIPLDPAEEELGLEGQVTEESIPIVSSEASEGEVVSVSIASEKDAEEDPATSEEPFPSTPEESVVLVHPETDTELEAAAEETAREQPAVIVLVEPTREEPTPEDPILIVPVEDLEEDAPEHNTEHEVVESDPLPKEAVPDVDAAPEENEAGDSDAEILVMSVTGTPSEAEGAEIVLDPGEEVVATQVVPAVNDTEAGSIPAPVEGGNSTSMETYGEDFQEPEVLLNRGAVLGAAFFTLMSFIIIGFVWTTVSKKLR